MINVLDSIIEALVNYNGKINATISFDTPDENFNIQKPAVNFFLYDIRENYPLRTSNQYSMPLHPSQKELTEQGTKRMILHHQPTNVDFSYLITAWANDNSNKAKDEHRLLGNVLKALAPYQSFPEKILEGTSFAGMTPKPRITFLHSSLLSNIGEFWSALKGNPKPTLHFTVTMPVSLPEDDIDVSLVTRTETEVEPKY